MEKNRYLNWYKLAVELADDPALVPPKSDDRILADQISQEGWLMFGMTKNDALTTDMPNIFIKYANDNFDNFHIGVVFNTIGSVRRIQHVLEGYELQQKERLLQFMQTIRGWKTIIKRKTKKANFAQTPVFVEVKTYSSEQLRDQEKIIELFNIVKEIEQDGKAKAKLPKGDLDHVSQEFPTINIIEKLIPATEVDFSNAFREAFEILRICRKVKTAAEYLKERKQKTDVRKCMTKTCNYRYPIWAYSKDYRGYCKGCGEKLDYGVMSLEKRDELQKDSRFIAA